ncbi:MAG: TIGR04372 family glycosyltransferase [Bacteriovoracia bacterium]
MAAVLLGIAKIFPFQLVYVRAGVIGDFTTNLDYWASYKFLHSHEKQPYPIFFRSAVVSNKYLLSLWKKRVMIMPRFFTGFFSRLYAFCSSNKELAHLKFRLAEARGGVHLEQTLWSSPIAIAMPKADQERCREVLAEIGLPKNAKFFIFHGRDNAYKSWLLQNHKEFSAKEDKTDLKYNFRNVEISTYLPAVIDLVESHGLYAVRLGKVVKGSLGAKNPLVIDYASSDLKSDMLDIFLTAHCEFCLSSVSGIDTVPVTFRKPVFRANFIPIGHACQGVFDFFIPKKITREDGTPLSLQQIFDAGIGYYFSESDRGFRVVNNTDEEIRQFALDAFQECFGGQNLDDEALAVRERFAQIMKKNGLEVPSRCRIGIGYAKANPWFLA